MGKLLITREERSKYARRSDLVSCSLRMTLVSLLESIVAPGISM